MQSSRRTALVGLALLALALMSRTAAPAAAQTADQVETLPGRTAVVLAGDRDVPARVARRDPGPDRAAASGASFTVTYNGFPAEARAAFQAAVDVWAARLSSPVPVVVVANWTPLGGNVLGSAGPDQFYRGFSGAPNATTWYPSAVANRLAGRDLGSGRPDIVANFNSTYSNWYYGTDGNTPAGRFDLMSVVLHELGHGLGFVSSFYISGSTGVYGQGAGQPFAFDRGVVNGSGASLVENPAFPNDSAALAGQLTSNNLYWSGAAGVAAAGGGRPRLYAPSTWNEGSSISHLDEAAYPAGNPNALMTPVLNGNESVHDPGPIALGILNDIGWGATAAPQPTPTPTPGGSACTSVSLTASPVSPRPAGTSVTFTASASGCSSPQYKFWVYSEANGWRAAQGYGTASTFTWTTTGLPATSYYVAVFARRAGSTVDPEAQTSLTYTLTGASGCSAVTLTPSPASPQPVGTTVTWTASASGCSSPQYKFWVYSAAGGWQMVRDYAAGSTFSWSTGSLAAGTYYVAVFARAAGSTTDPEAQVSRTFVLNASASAAACSTASLTMNPPSQATPGTSVALTASAAGCVSPQYKFWVYSAAGGWQVVRDYAAGSTFTWSTTGLPAGSYYLAVWARAAGSGAEVEAQTSRTYTLTAAATACTAVSLAPTPSSSAAAGTAVSLTASASGCASPQYQYWVYSPSGGWSVLRDWTTSRTITWSTPPSVGTYYLAVRARASGSTAALEAQTSIVYALQ